MNKIALIDSIIEEHKIKIQKFQRLEIAVNDFEIASELSETLEAFMPERFDSKRKLRELQQSLEAIERWLKIHFDREESSFFTAFENHEDKELIADYKSLLRDHVGLKTRLANARKLVTTLIEGGLSAHVWQASAHDMRAYISNTRKLVELHASTEENILLKIRSQLVEAQANSV